MRECNSKRNVAVTLTCCSDLGAHVDGFIAVVAHTFVVGASEVKVVVKLN